MAMKALFLSFTLKESPRVSSTQAPVDRQVAVFKEPDAEDWTIWIIDYDVAFRASSDKEEEDEFCPGKVKACNIPVLAIPVCFCVPSIAKIVTERECRTYTEGDVKTGKYPFYWKTVENLVSGTGDCVQDYVLHG